MLCQVHGNNYEYDKEVYFIQDQELYYRAAVSVILQLTVWQPFFFGGGGGAALIKMYSPGLSWSYQSWFYLFFIGI